ncbi:MAG: GNAT family N-acetyltransferase [Lachnotalea sp.]
MLDKSIPYKRIIMKLDSKKNKFNQDIKLPRGYFFQMYEPGLELDWAETEAEVLEYETKEKALAYFKKELIPYQDELEKRMVFIRNHDGVIVANACAWYINYKGLHQAQVHFVAVKPDYQGIGLGKAIFTKILTLFQIYEAGHDVYLHTQTWSHIAIQMYLDMGFEIIKDESLGYRETDLEEAIAVLNLVYDETTMERIRGNRYQYKLKLIYKSIIIKIKSAILSET